jgi:GT2 family glycosyltransferase
MIDDQHNQNLIPEVSICIPTYNRLGQLRDALDSCFAQTFTDYEIVITDNSDNGETFEYIKSLGRQNIRYYKNLENIGPVKNFALSIEKGIGSFIKPLMDDDILHPTALEEMVSAMHSHLSAGVVMAPLAIINSLGKPTDFRAYLIKKIKILYRYRAESQLIPARTILDDFLTREYPCCVPSGLMYRKECFDRLGPIDPKVKFIVDVDICARFATKYDFYYIDKPLASWRHSELSHTVVNLHQKGQDTVVYYYLTDKLCADPRVLSQYLPAEIPRLKKRAYFFASKRAVLSIIAGVRSGNPGLVFQTCRLMKKHDPYPSNLFLLPFNIMGEIIKAALSWFR